MGGGGFTMDERSPALDRFALELTGGAGAAGLLPADRERRPARAGHALLRPLRGMAVRAEHPVAVPPRRGTGSTRSRTCSPRTSIYVGGGSMRNMLAIWREHGIDDAMREAWASGIVLAGLSAGAMCWFEGGVSKSGGTPEAVSGIGLLPGSLSVHLGLPSRSGCRCTSRPSGGGRLPPGFAADDGAALRVRAVWRCRSASRRGRTRACCGWPRTRRGPAACRALACRSGCCRVRPVVRTGRSVRSKRTGWPSCASCGRGQGGGGTRGRGRGR